MLLLQFLNISLICTPLSNLDKTGYRNKVNFSFNSIKEILKLVSVDFFGENAEKELSFSEEEILENFELSHDGNSNNFKIQLDFVGPFTAINKIGFNNYLPELTSPPPKQFA